MNDVMKGIVFEEAGERPGNGWFHVRRLKGLSPPSLPYNEQFPDGTLAVNGDHHVVNPIR
jgi:hypothetical protein